uniref:Phylloplanin n=1 Tax=Anthurium amnicola TaxID=1678845 RepID=A0A1D1YJ53_9ARAE
MAPKFTLFAAILLAGVATAQVPHAQLPPLGDLGLVRISGNVLCSFNAGTAAATPAFPNAEVQLHCRDAVVSSVTTNSAGAFSMLLDPITPILSSLLNNCKLVVSTPLSTCNAALPSAPGLLQSPLTLAGTALQGLLTVVNIVASGFSLVQ